MKLENLLFYLLIISSFSSCTSDTLSPGVEFMPDMYRSPSYETYSVNALYSDSMSARKPVEGTIPRGFMPYMNPDNNEGYAKADSLKMPEGFNTPAHFDEGKRLFTIYCSPCHGAGGKGDGLVAQKFPGPPPAYSSPQLKNLSEGKMFHSITYGKNLMGPHASLLRADQRWMIITFIKTLQNPAQEGAAKDSTVQNKVHIHNH